MIAYYDSYSNTFVDKFKLGNEERTNGNNINLIFTDVQTVSDTSLARGHVIRVLGSPSLDHLKFTRVLLDREGHSHDTIAWLDDGENSSHLNGGMGA